MKPNPREEPAEQQSSAARESDRGRRAKTPTQVPQQGWLDILWRTKQQLTEDNLTIVAAGVAYYAFVAAIPALAATIAIYGLVADPSQVGSHLESLAAMLPPEVAPLLHEQLTRITSDTTTAGWGAGLGIALALFGSMRATKAMIIGLNITYDETERRGFFKLLLVSLVLTLAGVIGVLTLVTLVAVLPAVLSFLGLSANSETLVNWIRWPLVVILFMAGLAVIYRFGSCRDEPQWKWVSAGAIAATVLWILGSAAFSFYVSRFGSYDETYGSLGAVVIFLLWLYLSAYVVLLGAELNSEIERQTVKDTTKGEPKPLGDRDAYAADNIGPARNEDDARKNSDRSSRRLP